METIEDPYSISYSSMSAHSLLRHSAKEMSTEPCDSLVFLPRFWFTISDTQRTPWFVRLFGCGQQPKRISKQIQGVGVSDAGLVSEITQVGDYLGDSQVLTVPIAAPPPASEVSEVCVKVSKLSGDKLGLKLYRSSLQVQSFEPGTALWKFVHEVPSGSTIHSVNGHLASMSNIRDLLRDCLNQILVDLVFTISVKPPYSRRTLSSHRMSYSSQSSTGPSPAGRILSDIARRGSSDIPYEPCQPEEKSQGMTQIDFEKLSKESMSMWTRKTSMISRNSHQSADSFSAEYGESPTSWRRRKLEARTRQVEDDDGLEE